MRQHVVHGLSVGLMMIVWTTRSANGQTGDGSITAWGNNDFGQLNVLFPNSGFIAAAGGSEHSLGLKVDGSIVAWGMDSYGQCDVPDPNIEFIAVAAGWYHSLGLKSDGSIVAWGAGGIGQSDFPHYGQSVVPVANTGFIALAAGAFHSLGLKSDGSVVAWGAGSSGQIGFPHYGQSMVPDPNSDFSAVAGGPYHSLGLKSDGSIMAWGAGGLGQVGFPHLGQSIVPDPNSEFMAIASGDFHNLGLKTDSSIVAWGAGGIGQSDEPHFEQSVVPEPNTGFIAVAAGNAHSLGLKADRTIVAWGAGGSGQSGGFYHHGQSIVPALNSRFVGVAAGPFHSFGLKEPLPNAGDLDDDGDVDLTDYQLMASCVTGPAAAAMEQSCAPGDFDLDQRIDLLDIAGFMLVFQSTVGDSDGDFIPDVFETDDGVFVNALATGTDPFNWDTDGDFIADGDEVYGTLDGLDLPMLGASPLRRDIFIEADWTDDAYDVGAHSHRPSAAMIAAIESAFSQSPTPNPYNNPDGISLHVDFGQGGAFTGGNLIAGSPEFIFFGSEFASLKALHFSANRQGYFHYSIFSHRYNNNANTSSGVAELSGDDFMVTLWSTPQDVSRVSKTLMHEIGHNLGLDHGGDEGLNQKPNYNSIMNYRYSFPGIDTDCDAVGDGVPDYSLGLLPTIDENKLNECDGICGSSFPIDWNESGGFCETNIAYDITVGQGGSSSLDILHDFDDWSAIGLDGIRPLGRALPEVVTCMESPSP